MKNYKKTVLILLLGFSFNNAFSQNVGINNNSPKQKLQVSRDLAGTTLDVGAIGTTGINLIQPTIRIDGLNATNNASVFPVANTTNPLYINTNGDTSVILGANKYLNSDAGTDAITATTINPTSNYSIGIVLNTLTPDLLSTTFTLSQTSIVDFSLVLSANVQSASGGVLTDNKVRHVSAGIYFTAASPTNSGITLDSSAAYDGVSYTSGTGGLGDSLLLNPSLEMVLPAGTYTVCARGVGSALGTGDTASDFRIIFGGGANDKLNIIARPL